MALTKNGVPILNPQEAQFQYGPLPIIWDMKRKQVHELWKAKNLPIVKTEKDTEIYSFVSGKVKFDIECGFSNGKLCKYRVRQLDKVNGMFPIDSNWVSKSEYGLQLKK